MPPSDDRAPAGPPAGVAAIGESALVTAFALAGADIRPTETPQQARAAWHALPRTVALVLLTPLAAEAIGEDRVAPGAPLSVVTPP